MSNFIKFLGTAGARFVMIEQLRSSAGTILSLDGQTILLDPGPGTLSRCASSRPKIAGHALDAVLLSHRHIDHSTDVNVMLEAMSHGGRQKRGLLFAPADCLEGDDPVVLRYVRDYITGITRLQPFTRYELGGLCFHTRGRHRHGVETYGFVFESRAGRLAFLIDTEFFPDLMEWYAGARVLVLNVVLLKQREENLIQHLCLDDARRLISAIRPETAILTHFGMSMVRARPWLLAEQLTQETGVPVLAARDGMSYTLDDM
ncbi:MAG: MBL fold metallo-hydrolase [candidate division KSB1 bacterium]|nr:MBL fold metallo-hydrolase [candidate division KSB1 bacterium]MDZ7273832.1 MBL fold metallo-hydrolase [candidate division KSB1 bacterium]MDZ7285988.1 MBL fold metallo-hydrolase [candidate division KSB1 bacterium]MDZ7299020.1 MBL fold metallo-hydrolase [candidate division KSB1 bacterium]MDZ7309579.1 MBL fold metallo-hydrolase [candidate division KSB1 bacterium]